MSLSGSRRFVAFLILSRTFCGLLSVAAAGLWHHSDMSTEERNQPDPPEPPRQGLLRYRIIGRAHPERSGYWFEPIDITTSDTEGPLVRIQAQMSLSQFSAQMELRTVEAPDWSDVKVNLEDIVRTVLDAIGLYSGSAVECEVVQMELPDGEVIVLNSSFDGLEIDYEQEAFRSTWMAAQLVRGLRLGLADFRLAIRTPHDTLFLVYRALDGIRADIADMESIGDGKASWERMREITSLSRNEIDDIKAKADLRRHGRSAPLTNEERRGALSLLQTALVRYRDWCTENLDEVRRFVAGETIHATVLIPEKRT